MVGHDRHDFRHQSGLGEVPLRRVVSLVGGDVVRDVQPVVVAGLVSGQGQQADQRNPARRSQNGQRPAHDRGTYPPPASGLDPPSGVEQSESTADHDHGRNQCRRDGDGHDHADCAWHTDGLEVRHAAEAQAEGSAGDRQTGCQHHVGDAVVRRIERRFTIFAVLACLLITAEEENRVVGARRNSQRYQQINGEGGQPDELVVAEERDYSSGRGQFDEDCEQQAHHRPHRAVHEQQHGENHQHGDHGDLDEGAVAAVVHVRHQRRGAGHVGRHAFGCGSPVHDVPDGLDRLFGKGGALVAGEIQLDVDGLAVGALRARRRERIPPEVLHVLDVRRIGSQLSDDAVVVTVGVVTEFGIAFQNKHREIVGIRFLE